MWLEVGGVARRKRSGDRRLAPGIAYRERTLESKSASLSAQGDCRAEALTFPVSEDETLRGSVPAIVRLIDDKRVQVAVILGALKGTGETVLTFALHECHSISRTVRKYLLGG